MERLRLVDCTDDAEWLRLPLTLTTVAADETGKTCVFLFLYQAVKKATETKNIVSMFASARAHVCVCMCGWGGGGA